MNQRYETSRKPVVAHLMPWSGIGGVEIATLRLVRVLHDQFSHVAFCLPDATDLINSFRDLGIETHIYTPPEPSLRHFPSYYRESQLLARKFKGAGVDIVHFSDEKAAYHSSLAALLAGTSRICHMRVSYPQLEFRRRLCLRPVQLFIFVSKEAKDTFAVSLPPHKARVIYDAIDIPIVDIPKSRTSVRQEFGIPENCAIVGTVARISPQKDYFTLASAAVEVLNQHPTTRFLIVGDNSLVDLNRNHYQEVSRRLAELGVQDSFIFTGHRKDTIRLAAAMDFCVLCTHREGFPLSILESMALQKPVIATSVGGIPEIVQQGITGYLHNHEDPNQLATWILHLINNPTAVQQMGLAAQEHVRSEHSKEKFLREMEQAYFDVEKL